MAYTTINKPTDYFEPITFTASNASSNTVSGMGFQPDLIWWKNREQTYPHFLYDVIRGNTKQLASNTTGAEETRDSTYLTSFNSDGFTTGTALAGDTSDGIASWNWKANGAGSANTDGSISSTVSANTTSGFSIVKWTNSTSNAGTIGHGLGVAPKMIIFKTTSAVTNWYVYNKSIGAGNFLEFNGTVGSQASANLFDNTEPTTSVFSTGTNPAFINSTMIAYCFSDVQGYSKFSSYTGNGNADGTFVYTGFKPAFILSKDVDSAGENWFIQDTTRNTSNPVGAYLRPNLSDAEGSFNHYDILSNGFKNLYAGGSMNGSGKKIIYMAFASAPLVGTNNVPCTAR